MTVPMPVDNDDELERQRRARAAALGPRAVEVVDRMMAIWPNPEWPDTLAREWLETLAGVRTDVAEAALEHMKRTCKRRPSFAEFHEAAGHVWQQLNPPPHLQRQRALAEPWLPAEIYAAGIAAARRQLAEHAPPPPRFAAPRTYERRMPAPPTPVGDGFGQVLDDLAHRAPDETPAAPASASDVPPPATEDSEVF